MARSWTSRIRNGLWLVAVFAMTFAAQALAEEWWERPWDYKVPLMAGQRPRQGVLLLSVNDMGGDPTKDNQRDISKSLGRVRKFRMQTTYRLNELRDFAEVLALGKGPMAEATAKAMPHIDAAEKIIAEAVTAQQAGNLEQARAKIVEAGKELSAGEEIAETAMAIRSEELHLLHLRNAAALAGMSELNAPIDAMAKTAAADAAARVKDLKAATAAQQETITLLRGKLAGIQADAMAKLECSDMLDFYEYLLLCEIKDGDRTENLGGETYLRDAAMSDMTLGSTSSIARRVLQLRARLRGVSYRMSALAGTPVQDTPGDKIAAKTKNPIDDLDFFTRSKFGIVRSWRMNDNNPWDWEFNYTPVAADAVSIAGRWDFQVDPKFEGEAKGWQKEDFKPTGWKNLYAPNAWERQGINEWNSIENFKECVQKVTGQPLNEPGRRGYEHSPEHRHYNGVAWYRKAVYVPKAWEGSNVILRPAEVGTQYRVYCNGQLADAEWKSGEISIPAAMVKCGQLNQLAVQFFNRQGFGGFTEGNIWLVRDGGKADWRLTATGGGWVNEETFGLPGGKSAKYGTIISSATPACLIATDSNTFDLWGWSMKGYAVPTEMTYAGPDGLKTAKLDAAKSVPGSDLKEGWVLLSVPAGQNQYGNSVLVVFQHKPTTLKWSADKGAEGLSAEFGKPAGTVAMIRLGKAGADSAALAAKAQQWSKALLAYPEHASELWTVDATKKNLAFEVMGKFNLIYNYYTIKDDWNTKPVQMAGLPALASYGLEYKYPGLAEGDAEKTGAPIAYQAYAVGEFRAKTGTDRISYTAPCGDNATMWKGIGTLFQEATEPQGRAAKATRKWGSNNDRAGFAFHMDWHTYLVKGFGLEVKPQTDPKWLELDKMLDIRRDIGLFTFILDFSNDVAPDPSTPYYPHTGGYLRRKPEAMNGLAEFWTALATRTKNRTAEQMGFNFNNEPCTIDCEMYNKLTKRLTQAVRTVSKDKWITLDFGDGWAQPDFVFGTEPTGDKLTAYNYHLYYKHDGILEGQPELLFPQYNPKDPYYWCNSEDLYVNRIQDTFLYQIVHKVPVWCGEFGGSVNNPNQEMLLWCEEHCTMMERMGHGWSWWNWNGQDYGRTGLQDRTAVNPVVMVLKRFMHRKGAF